MLCSSCAAVCLACFLFSSLVPWFHTELHHRPLFVPIDAVDVDVLLHVDSNCECRSSWPGFLLGLTAPSVSMSGRSWTPSSVRNPSLPSLFLALFGNGKACAMAMCHWANTHQVQHISLCSALLCPALMCNNLLSGIFRNSIATTGDPGGGWMLTDVVVC